MRIHSSKRTLSAEVVGLRKQVNDLKEAALVRRRVEDALRLSEGMYRSVVEDAPVGLARLGRDGRLLLANHAFVSVLGYSSVAEFRTIGGITGLFATDEDQARLLGGGTEGIRSLAVNVRYRDGSVLELRVLARWSSDAEALTLLCIGGLAGERRAC